MNVKKRQSRKATTLLIKNMVCPRCIKVVRQELEALGHDVRNVILGEVTVSGPVSDQQLGQIKKRLEDNGFELVEDRTRVVIEKIKHAVLALVQNDYELKPIRIKDSEFISKEVGQDYHSLSSLFSSVENITIEHYTILQRIERAKELLKYGEMTLSEISYKLGYSSVAHLSNQFKQVTGMTPTAFKNMSGDIRRPVTHVHF
jgi:AraC family transcriptional regulator